MKIPDDLKKAIKEMPEKEKDKLLLRLIPKNLMLMNQLYFKLIEEESTMEERRESVKSKISARAAHYPKMFYSPGYLMMEMRELSGLINDHVSVTKDKHGEIELQLWLLNSLISKNLENLVDANYYSRPKFDEYIVKRAKKITTLLSKIHEDFLMDYSDDLKQLGQFFLRLKIERVMVNENFQINHLVDPPSIFSH
ncbi:MAG: hypothetical protein RIA69_00830 [Cyclobacteriaceae bacterium]